MLLALLEETGRKTADDIAAALPAEASPRERLQAFALRLHEWCEPFERRHNNGAHDRHPTSILSLPLAVDDPERGDAAMAPSSRLTAGLVGDAIAAGAIRRMDARLASLLLLQTPMCRWLGNRLTRDPAARATADPLWELCRQGLGPAEVDRVRRNASLSAARGNGAGEGGEPGAGPSAVISRGETFPDTLRARDRARLIGAREGRHAAASRRGRALPARARVAMGARAMPEDPRSTREIYDRSSASWARTDKLLLSDFTARPFVLDRLQPLAGCRVLDLGCGEGYVARQIQAAGAASVLGIDLSQGMIDQARIEEERNPQGIEYRQADAAELAGTGDGAFDRVAAVFLFNYVETGVMTEVMRRVHRCLAPGGRFVFTVPHPSLPFMRGEAPPFFFQRDGAGYFTARDRTLEGSIWRRDGVVVPVRCVHKPLEAYFEALHAAGWTGMPEVLELRVQPEHVELDRTFFEPLVDHPLHLLFAVERPE